jgi:hypothetical protein
MTTTRSVQRLLQQYRERLHTLLIATDDDFDAVEPTHDTDLLVPLRLRVDGGT